MRVLVREVFKATQLVLSVTTASMIYWDYDTYTNQSAKSNTTYTSSTTNTNDTSTSTLNERGSLTRQHRPN